MSELSQGPGWWQASDGKWYAPEQRPGPAAPAYPAGPYAVAAGPRTNTMAILSLVLSLVSCGVGSIAAIILGHMAKKQIAESGGTETGEGLATAGLIIGYIGLALTVVGVVAWVIAFATIENTNDFDNDFGMAVLGLLPIP
jgi:hypothetical protein